ncbi:hypothetical protein LTR49_027931 [Elasticomyces elasticus]|nr:hypothetical protein LTR49_027931 [Elasticomyces elasticus]
MAATHAPLSRPPSSREDFQVTVICALPEEPDTVEAVMMMHFKSEGRTYSKARGEDNTYTTGVLGGKLVVLVGPRDMGTTNTRDLARGYGRNPRLDPPQISVDYYNQPQVPDYLFEADFADPQGAAGCEGCAESMERVVTREPRFLRDPPADVGTAKFVKRRGQLYRLSEFSLWHGCVRRHTDEGCRRKRRGLPAGQTSEKGRCIVL